jgi:hypothetical protein
MSGAILLFPPIYLHAVYTDNFTLPLPSLVPVSDTRIVGTCHKMRALIKIYNLYSKYFDEVFVRYINCICKNLSDAKFQRTR